MSLLKAFEQSMTRRCLQFLSRLWVISSVFLSSWVAATSVRSVLLRADDVPFHKFDYVVDSDVLHQFACNASL